MDDDAARQGTAALVDEIRALARTSVRDALARADAAVRRRPDDGALLYLLAELHARSGRSHEALDLIDRAVVALRAAHDDIGAARCAVGRVSVLDDLGRHDEAISTATAVIERLRDADGDAEVCEIVVRALSNRALCLESIGDYERAHDDYDAAARLAPSLLDPLLLAQLQINRANVLDLLGRSADAIDALVAALPVIESFGEREDAVKVAANLGAMSCRRGEFEEGLAWLARAERDVEPDTVDACAIHVEAAEAYAGMGALDEAVTRYRQALTLLADSPISWVEGRALLGLGITLGRRGAVDAARSALRGAIDAFQASDNLPSTLAALLELARVEAADPTMRAIAADELRRALALADVDRWPVQACTAQLRLGELEHGVEGERLLRSALRLAERCELAPLRMRAHQQLGRHLLGHRRTADAKPHVESAVSLAETLRSRLRHHSLLRLFPSETVSCYEDLVALRLAEGDVDGAADAADRARSRSLLDRGFGPPGRSAEIDELELELDVLYDRLLGGRDDALAERTRLEQRARDLEGRLERARLRFVQVSLDDGADQADAAPRDEAPVLTLLYHVHGGDLGVFVRDDAGRTRWCPAIASIDDVVDELERFHADGRRTLAMRAAGIAPSDTARRAARRRLDRLGEMLLGPVVDDVLGRAGTGVRAAAAPVSVVPTGALWSVPFAALGLGGAQLVDVAAVAVTPSVALGAARPAAANGRAVVVGVSGLGVPGAVAEASGLAQRLGAQVLLDDAATLDALRRACAAPGPVSVLHLASHGVHRPHAPLQSGVRLADGWLTAHRAAELSIRGATVVLSACDTGRSSVADGEEVLGAQYGFLAAGARSVVVSLWPAHDRHTVDLMADLHDRLAAGDGPADALRHAQLGLRDREAHAWWWAPFTVSGAR